MLSLPEEYRFFSKPNKADSGFLEKCLDPNEGNSLSLAVPKSNFLFDGLLEKTITPPRINMDTKPGGSENVSPFKHGYFRYLL